MYKDLSLVSSPRCKWNGRSTKNHHKVHYVVCYNFKPVSCWTAHVQVPELNFGVLHIDLSGWEEITLVVYVCEQVHKLKNKNSSRWVNFDQDSFHCYRLMELLQFVGVSFIVLKGLGVLNKVTDLLLFLLTCIRATKRIFTNRYIFHCLIWKK